MSERGCVWHLRASASVATKRLATLPIRSAVLAANRRWTSFVPVGVDHAVDATALAHHAGTCVLQVWFDEDSAIVLRFHQPDAAMVELSLSFDAAEGWSSADDRLVADLVARRIVTGTTAAALARAFRRPAGERGDWARAHGVERLLELPFVAPVPVPCSAEVLAAVAPTATLIGPGPRPPTPVLPPAPPAPATRRPRAAGPRSTAW